MLKFAISMAALMAAPMAAHAQNQPAPKSSPRPAHDRIVDVAKGDPEMVAAIAKARAELPAFFRRSAAPGPGETYFLIKYNLTPQGVAEFIWAEVISHQGETTLARLINNPRAPGFAKGQQVTVRTADIIDFGYVKNGVMQGNYTTRVVLPHMAPAEAAALRRAYGW
ncbi:DUF2314 domain-containing protein [Sphingomonas sp. AOB5]|uniref:DUF2314 domain-containing protein n=1 Tax=Sphingomonas sp. AOB5 TaxID=3034017 RepID=UPI0023F9D109|nr:DUF2314 domain-containing protein [Sphingomonas sp. AOB5]MDF7777662.1 DUF2314 domain-containing protein [Sphingomonas sp. AOB5]